MNIYGKIYRHDIDIHFTASSREIGDEHRITKFLYERGTGKQRLDKQQKDICTGLE
jgi:hypothetical protein